MTKFAFVGCVGLLIIACGGPSLYLQTQAYREKNRSNLIKLNLGMTKGETLDIMGVSTDTLRSFSLQDKAPLAGPAKAVYNNPFRSAAFTHDGLNIEVLYYYTDLKQEDGAITDDELTPLVFFDNKLAGWGWDFWDDTAAKYEIRIR